MSALHADLLERSPALRLLRRRSAGRILTFLEEAFHIRQRVQVHEEALEAELDRMLKDGLWFDEEIIGEERLPPTGREFLNRWCDEEYRMLRKFFAQEAQGFVYQLTPDAETVIRWVRELQTGEARQHTSAKSRFHRIRTELNDLAEHTSDNPDQRLAALQRQRDAIDEQIMEIRRTGRVETLEQTEIRDRLYDLEQLIGQFLGDFRAMEQHFKGASAHIHDQWLLRRRSKGDIVSDALDAEQALRESDQGRSYYGFRDLLASPSGREHLRSATQRAAELAAAHGADPATFANLLPRCSEELAQVQESFRRISAQLRLVVEESRSAETRILQELLGDIRRLAPRLADCAPEGVFWEMDDDPALWPVMEWTFYEPKEPARPLTPQVAEDESLEQVREALRHLGEPLPIDRCRDRVLEEVAANQQISLRELLTKYPPTAGPVEVLCYLAVALENDCHHILEGDMESHLLLNTHPPLQARLEKILYQEELK